MKVSSKALSLWPQWKLPLLWWVRGWGLSDSRGVAAEETSEIGRDIWAVGAYLLPFSRANLRIKWHEIEHRPGSPQETGDSSRPWGENARGREWEGWPGNTLHCFWVQMEENGRGLGSAPPPGPPSSSDKHKVCQTPATGWAQSGFLLPKCPWESRLGVNARPEPDSGCPSGLFAYLSISLLPLFWGSKNRGKREPENLALFPKKEKEAFVLGRCEWGKAIYWGDVWDHSFSLGSNLLCGLLLSSSIIIMTTTMCPGLFWVSWELCSNSLDLDTILSGCTVISDTPILQMRRQINQSVSGRDRICC
jgi:hypothetical protein